jgi:hypothetical protein
VNAAPEPPVLWLARMRVRWWSKGHHVEFRRGEVVLARVGGTVPVLLPPDPPVPAWRILGLGVWSEEPVYCATSEAMAGRHGDVGVTDLVPISREERS